MNVNILFCFCFRRLTLHLNIKLYILYKYKYINAFGGKIKRELYYHSELIITPIGLDNLKPYFLLMLFQGAKHVSMFDD